MFKKYFKNWQAKRSLNQCKHAVMKEYLQAFIGATLNNEKILALDFETTGLNPATDKVVSVGWIQVDDNKIDASSARYFIVNADTAMNQSAIIHGLTDSQILEGVDLSFVMQSLLAALQGRRLLAHNASIEVNFLNKITLELYDTPIFVEHLDTMLIEKNQFNRRNQTIQSNDLRLMNCRKRYNLPAYKAHNALSDALACAELFIAQQV